MSNERFNLSVETLKKLDFKLLYISASKYEGDWQSIPHTHHFTELFYVINGRGSFLVEQKVSTVEENDLVIVNPYVEHTELSLNSNPMEYLVFGIEGLSFDFGERESENHCGFFSHLSNHRQLLNFAQILIKETGEKQSGYELICHAVLEILLIEITRHYKLGFVSSPASIMSRECAQAKRYLDTNYAQNITLDSLSSAIHVNKYHLAHVFSNCLGISPISYLIQRRLIMARELLATTNYSIAYIASSTGFSSQSYFSQIFKKFTDVSPIQYRKLHNEKDGGYSG